MSLKEQVVVITGGGGALGQAVTKAFLKAGGTVAIPYIIDAEADNLKRRFRKYGNQLVLYKADVTDERSLRSFYREVVNNFGRVDALVNLVGGFSAGPTVAELDTKEWDRMMDLNLKSAFISCKVAIPFMKKERGGRIINMSSRAAVKGSAGASAYSVSKAGVVTLTQALAEELLADDITVNALMPSIIDTPANRQAMPNADYAKWPKAEDIAKVILFLASDDSKLISGAAIPVYGKG